MPSAYFSRLRVAYRRGTHKFIQEQKGLGDSVDFLFRQVRLLGSSAFSLSIPFSTLREGNLLSRSSEHYTRAGCQVCIDNIGRSFSRSAQRPQNSLQGKIMAAGGSLSAQAKLGSHCVETTSLKSVQLSSFGIHPAVSYNNQSIKYGKVTMSLRNQEPRSNLVYGYFLFDVIGRSWKPSLFSLPTAKGFQTSCLAPHSAGAAPDMSFDGGTGAEQLISAAVSPDQKLPGERSLKLLSGSCYLPHPDKEETGGEDAHFICVDEQAIGVADGVGGWADVGIDAGHYARELMSHSVNAIQEEPKGSIDPARVLQKAYSSTKAKGSSTACIIALTEEGIHAVNLGDSGFVVVREGCTIFRSTVQQHDFNFPYQLASCNESDPPSSGQVSSIPVAAGDVIIAGTDGLFDNLYNNEVTAVVVHAVRAGLGPHVTAQKIAALARQRAQDRNRQTPFSTAAQDAGYRYYGGKLDDITVIVSYITASI